MLTLPEHIVQYLAEAGFTQTELLMLKHLFSGKAMTLRELAKMTGKSTGVLDQGMRKLITKGVVEKRSVNGSPKYIVESYDALRKWVRKDLKHTWETIKRKQEHLDLFIDSVKEHASHPEVRHFEGVEGMREAFVEILSTGMDLLQCFPFVPGKQDPLREFREECTKLRRRKGIFARIIADDSLDARRWKARDAYALRKTVLVPDLHEECDTEKIVSGNTVGYFDFGAQRACLIVSPVLAKAERHVFEVLWGLMIHDDQVALDDDEAEVTLGPLAPDTLAVRMYAGLPHWTRELLKSLRMIRHGQLRDSAASRKPLKICTKDRPGIVHDITRCFAARDIQISSLRVFAAPPGGPYTFFDLEYEVKNPEHQEYLLRELRRVPNVIDIKNT